MHLPESVENLVRAISDTYDRSMYKKFLNLKTRIDTSSKDDIHNRYASVCVPPAFEIIRGELIKLDTTKHEVRELEDQFSILSVSDN